MNREAERPLLCFKDTSGLVGANGGSSTLTRCIVPAPPCSYRMTDGGKSQHGGNLAACTGEGPASGVYRDRGHLAASQMLPDSPHLPSIPPPSPTSFRLELGSFVWRWWCLVNLSAPLFIYLFFVFGSDGPLTIFLLPP